MRAELMPFGFVIGGPHNMSGVRATAEEAEAWIKELIEGVAQQLGTTYTRDDFTVTAVFAKAWSGNLDTLPTAPDWDTVYAGQIMRDAANILEAAEQAGGVP